LAQSMVNVITAFFFPLEPAASTRPIFSTPKGSTGNGRRCQKLGLDLAPIYTLASNARFILYFVFFFNYNFVPQNLYLLNFKIVFLTSNCKSEHPSLKIAYLDLKFLNPTILAFQLGTL
jgi:hypothetical protein